jgi:biotin carboxyl carrier protein
VTEAAEPPSRAGGRATDDQSGSRAGGRAGVDQSAGWMDALREIIAAFEASDATELELRTPPLRIALRRKPGILPTLPAALDVDADAHLAGLHVVHCPLTGVWYDAPSPGAPPYVNVGDPIEVGMTVGLVETMKVFNEVTSDVAGVVRQILAHRGDLVAAHAPLLAVEPGEVGAALVPTT